MNLIVTLNNAFRIFMITGDYNTCNLCNIEDFQRCYDAITDKSSIKITHKWNNRFIRCSKKSVIDMLKSLDLEYEFLIN